MEKDGDDMYFKRLSIIQGIEYCEEMDEDFDEIYSDETNLCLVIPEDNIVFEISS